MNAVPCPVCPSSDAPLQLDFQTILPRVELRARIAFRDVRCPHRKADCIAEAVALAWAWYRRLTQRGVDVTRFVSVLAVYAARAVRSGRRVCGQEKARDVLSSVAQRRHGFVVSSLPEVNTLDGNAWDEALLDNTQTEVPEQVCFRLDFPRWRLSRAERDRRLIDRLMVGERTQDVARRFGLTPSRVSQLRREFAEDWARFCGAPEPAAPTSARAGGR